MPGEAVLYVPEHTFCAQAYVKKSILIQHRNTSGPKTGQESSQVGFTVISAIHRGYTVSLDDHRRFIPESRWIIYSSWSKGLD